MSPLLDRNNLWLIGQVRILIEDVDSQLQARSGPPNAGSAQRPKRFRVGDKVEARRSLRSHLGFAGIETSADDSDERGPWQPAHILGQFSHKNAEKYYI